MTGNVIFPSAAGSVARSPLARVAPSYSVDAFTEFSFFAITRMPSTSAMIPGSTAVHDANEGRTTQEQDEELFRDLFAADNDWDTASTLSHHQGHLSKKDQIHANPKAPIIWGSGASSSQFLSSPFVSPPPVASLNQAPLALSAPVPRLNFADLMNARPNDGSIDNGVLGGWGHGLRKVAEEDARDERDECEENEERPESNAEPASLFTRKPKLSKLKPDASANNNTGSSSAIKLQQETLNFLEKLDLKALLHTPRPDVLDFCPASALSGAAPLSSAAAAAGNSIHSTQFAGKVVDDARVESECDLNQFLRANKTAPVRNSGKKDTGDVSVRLSHMESTYGTTKSEARKARKGTIERLANPILGFTSTLQALSPEQRRKREMALGEDGWNPCVSSPAGTKLSKKDLKAQRAERDLDHLTNSARIYEAAATVSSQRLYKSAGVRELPSSATLNNQQDDGRKCELSCRTPFVKRKPADKQSLSARKAALRKKIQEKQSSRSNQESAEHASSRQNGTSSGVTFLTQHEEEEAKLSSQAKRLQAARPTLPLPATTRPQDGSAESRQPRRPASVRVLRTDTPSQPSQGFKRGDRRGGGRDHEKPATATPHKGEAVAQKPSRTPGARQQQQQQQQALLATAPRKPSNSDGDKFSGRRSFARTSAVKASAALSVGSAESTPASVVKRQRSGAKGSAATMLLLGPTVQSTTNSAPGTASAHTCGSSSSRRGGNSGGRQGRKAQAPSTATTVRQSHTPRKQVSGSAFGNATPKEKSVSIERGRRLSKDATAADRASKSSITLPSIPSTKRRQGASEGGARRGNGFSRRARAT